MAFVIDASGMVLALLGRSPDAVALRSRFRTEDCHAPSLVDAEVGNVLRRSVLRKELAAEDAEALLAACWPLVDYRHEMTGSLAKAAWALRENVSFYDALYAALAGALAVPLVTADVRLAKAPGLRCAVNLMGGD
jgi:predicted nucleic acid-binding protein